MKSTASLFNKGLISSNLKRFWWASALYTFLLFFILPLRLIIQMDLLHLEYIRNSLNRMLSLTAGQNPVQVLLTLIVPVVLAILIFRYLHQVNAAAMFHSLPFNRKQLFASHVFSGLILLALPVIVNGILLLIFRVTTGLGVVYSTWDVLSWGGYTSLFILIMFSFAVFIGMFTGNSAAHLVFNYILHILPLGFYALLEVNLTQLIHGYSRFSISEPAFLEKLPFHSFGFFSDPGGLIFWYLAFTIVFLVVAFYVYKARHIEVAGDVISFQFIHPIFKYGVTMCSMLLGGAYFGSISEGNPVVIFTGYLISSLLGYFTAEMLIQKTYKVLAAYKGYLVYLVIVVMIFAGVQADVMGFTGYVPELDEIELAYLGGFHQFELLRRGDIDQSEVTGFYQKQENIKNIINLHRGLIEEDRSDTGRHLNLIYLLKDGNYIIREYRIDEEKHGPLLKPVYESMEYKQGRFPVLDKHPDEINRIELRDERVPEKNVTLSGEKEMKEFIMLLQDEIRELTFEEMSKAGRNYIHAVIEDEEGSISRNLIKESYDSLREWIKNNGYYEEFVIMPEDIQYISLLKDNRRPDMEQTRIKITQPGLIQEILNLPGYKGDIREGNVILAEFYYYGHHGRVSYIGQLYVNEEIIDELSEELRSYLEQLGF